MQRSFAYSFNNIKHWALAFGSKSSQIVNPQASSLATKYIWRNQMKDGYKISEDCYEDKPLDLSNYILLRTREQLLLQNRVNGSLTNNSGMLAGLRSKLYQNTFEGNLEACTLDLNENMESLDRIFRIDNTEDNLPVAFATNAMYVLARNRPSASSREIIEKRLLPIVKAKASYLHGEGVAQIAYALSSAQIWDEEAWAIVRDNIESHSYDCVVVKNDRWSLSKYSLMDGSEHLMQSDINRLGQDLFYQDKLNLFEMFNGLKIANKAAPSLNLGAAISWMGQRYAMDLDNNDQYLNLSATAAKQIE